jgi:hypothetical protein
MNDLYQQKTQEILNWRDSMLMCGIEYNHKAWPCTETFIKRVVDLIDQTKSLTDQGDISIDTSPQSESVITLAYDRYEDPTFFTLEQLDAFHMQLTKASEAIHATVVGRLLNLQQLTTLEEIARFDPNLPLPVVHSAPFSLATKHLDLPLG